MDSINRGDISKVLFKNTGIIAVGQISTKIINFFLLPLYTALLSKEEYGTIDLLSTYSSFLTVIVGVQLNQAAFRFLVTNREDKKNRKGCFHNPTHRIGDFSYLLYSVSGGSAFFDSGF